VPPASGRLVCVIFLAVTVSITRLHDLPPDALADVLAESERTGHRFLSRLVEEWESGTNRFARHGEVLFAAVADGRVVGVCGLNADPYLPEPGVGRVRHLYVAAEYRRRGVGRQLVGAVVAAARDAFGVLRLRTESASAARFYEALGFQRCAGVPACTHTLKTAG
jgi:GNAT superfamily N-acetyltransferase